MKKAAIFTGLLAVFLWAGALSAQVKIVASLFDWTPVTGTGQLGSYLNLIAGPRDPLTIYTFDWSVSGTAPSACTFQVEGSSDAVNWYSLATPLGSPISCTSSNMIHIPQRPVRLLRVNILTYTAGDGTTSAVFHFTGGR